MAVSPILLTSTPFDATGSHILQFTYSGSQIFANRLIIRNNNNNVIVYDKKVSSMTTYVTIPANTLENGSTYNFQVSVFDHEGVESDLSNIIVVQCLTTPVFKLSVETGTTIRNSYVDVEVTYSQENGELLNLYSVVLYANNQTTIVYNSGTKYSSESMMTRVTDLMDNSTYYLRATGETVNGMPVDTGLIEIICDYIKPDTFLTFRADNIKDEGIVRLSANFIMVEGSTTAEELIYIDDEKVSLLNGETVYWNSGFGTKNFTWDMRLESIPDFSKIITFNMKSVVAYVTWNYGYFDGFDEAQYYAELTAYQYVGAEQLRYIQTSNRINPLSEGQQVHIWIRHVDGMFDVIITPIEVVEDNNEETEEEPVEGSDSV